MSQAVNIKESFFDLLIADTFYAKRLEFAVFVGNYCENVLFIKYYYRHNILKSVIK